MAKLEEVTERRTLDQNKLMWSLINDVSRQVSWPVDGEMVFMAPDDWKHIFSSALKRNTRIARGIDGGFVVLGQYTSKFTKSEMSEMIDLILAFGGERGINWTNQS